MRPQPAEDYGPQARCRRRPVRSRTRRSSRASCRTAKTKLDAGDTPGAIEAFTRALLVDPNHPEALDLKMKAEEKRHQDSQAANKTPAQAATTPAATTATPGAEPPPAATATAATTPAASTTSPAASPGPRPHRPRPSPRRRSQAGRARATWRRRSARSGPRPRLPRRRTRRQVGALLGPLSRGHRRLRIGAAEQPELSGCGVAARTGQGRRPRRGAEGRIAGAVARGLGRSRRRAARIRTRASD